MNDYELTDEELVALWIATTTGVEDGTIPLLTEPPALPPPNLGDSLRSV